MQRYTIFHRTCYNYTHTVNLGPHQLLLRPREDYELRIESMTLSIVPEATLLWHRDVEGNSVVIATFTAPAQQLLIESEFVIQQYNETPLDFMVAGYAIDYPFVYLADDAVILSPYLLSPDSDSTTAVKQWISTIHQPGEKIQTYSLLQRLASWIYTTMLYQIREEPGVQSGEDTLSRGTGSCRDFAQLFIESARCLGLASRFVSGYLHSPQLSAAIGATHAWAEVYLPGAGWIGFDPTIGELAGSDHIAVAVARLADSVPPVSGSFSGSATSTLSVGVWVRKC